MRGIPDFASLNSRQDLGPSGAAGDSGRGGAHGSDHLLLTLCCRCYGDAVIAALWRSRKEHHDQHAGVLRFSEELALCNADFFALCAWVVTLLFWAYPASEIFQSILRLMTVNCGATIAESVALTPSLQSRGFLMADAHSQEPPGGEAADPEESQQVRYRSAKFTKDNIPAERRRETLPFSHAPES